MDMYGQCLCVLHELVQCCLEADYKNIRMHIVISRATIKKIMQIDITKQSVKHSSSIVINIKINQKASGKEEQKPEGQVENKIKWQS